jgi:hypothetical protein
MRHGMEFAVRFVVCLLFVAAVIPARAVAERQRTVRFVAAQVKTGQTITRTDEFTIDGDVKLKYAGSVVDEGTQHYHNIVKRTETVIQTSGKSVEVMKVHYDDMRTASRMFLTSAADNSGEKKGLLFGTTYILKNSAGKMLATYENGSNASNREIEALRDLEDPLGEENKLAAYLDNRAINIGDRLDIPVGVATTFLHLPDSGLEQLSMILKSVGNEAGSAVAVFEIQLKMTLRLSNHATAMELRGETAVGVKNARIYSISLEGPIRMRTLDQIGSRLVVVETQGTMKVREKNEYSQ